MASALGHVAVGAAVGFGSSSRGERRIPIWLCAVAACLPDIDYAIEPYVQAGSLWTHRGLTHSLVVHVVAVLACVTLLHLSPRGGKSSAWPRIAIGCMIALWSHAFLDAMTDGEPGVALASPFDPTRRFFAWRPIPVSPDSIGPFLGEWGLRVLKVELWFALAAWAVALIAARVQEHRARLAHRHLEAE